MGYLPLFLHIICNFTLSKYSSIKIIESLKKKFKIWAKLKTLTGLKNQ